MQEAIHHSHTEIIWAEGLYLGTSHASAKNDDYYYQSHFVNLFSGSQFLQGRFYTHSKSYKTLLKLIPVYSSTLTYVSIYSLTTSVAIQIKLREVLKFLIFHNFLTLHMLLSLPDIALKLTMLFTKNKLKVPWCGIQSCE